MAVPSIAPLPPDIELDGNYTLRLTAIDPATGDHVAGVNVSQLVITVVNANDQPITDLAVGPWELVPGVGA